MLPSLRPIPVGEMCARYTLRKRHLADVAEALGTEFAAKNEELFTPRYNVAPTDLALVVVSSAYTRVLPRR
jgi:putative SOS response-associated peptidase YedK